MSYQDKIITCVDCGDQFVFTANEQAFYAQRGFSNEPKRCASCRQNRKASRGSSFAGEGTQASGGFGGRREREMHTVKCSSCGGDAHVPFVPRGDRPVYCSDCYGSQRAESGYSRASRY